MRSAGRAALAGVGCAALAAAALGGGATGSRLECVGRSAHEVAVSGSGDEETVVVARAPGRDGECARGRESRQVCLGVNQDGACAAAGESSSVPLTGGLQCEGCFVALSTDVHCSLTMARRRVSEFRLGLAGARVLGTLSVAADESRPTPVYQGSVPFDGGSLKWSVNVTREFSFDIEVSWPMELYYSFQALAGGHAELGASLEVHLGDSYVQYTSGQGWSHHIDTPTLTVAPIRGAAHSAQANVTIGARTSLQLEAPGLMWFHGRSAPEVQLAALPEGPADPAHSCVEAAGRLVASHEAAVDLTLFGHAAVHRRWAPATGHQVAAPAVRRCAVVPPESEPDILV